MKKIIPFIAVLFLFSCEPIDFRSSISAVIPDGNKDLPKICIDGTVSSEKAYCMVRVYKPQEFSDNNVTPLSTSWENYNNLTGIEGAIITLKIKGKTYNFIEAESHEYAPEDYKQKGYYISIDSIEGMPGEEHILTIHYKNVDYIAVDIMPENVKINSLAELFPIEIYGYSYDRVVFGKPTGYIVKYDFIFKEYDYSFGVVDSSKFTLGHHINYNYFFSHYISPALMEEAKWTNSNIGSVFSKNFDAILKKHAISDEYQDYLIDFYSETYWKESNFRTTAATPVSNISNGALGFFSATNVDSIRTTKNEIEKVIVRGEF